MLNDKNIELWVVGRGEYENEMKSTPGVKYFGWLKHKQIKKFYQRATVLVHPAKWPEPFSRVWLEAIDNNIPLISSDNPSAIEVLKGCALFYKRGNPEDLKNKMKLAINGKSKPNYKMCKAKIDFNENIDKMIRLYREVSI